MRTPTELRIAIAKECGWKWTLADKRPGYSHYPHWTPPVGYVQPDHEARESAMVHPPDYLNDLNAMKAAEDTLTDEQYDSFEYELARVVSFQCEDEWPTPSSLRKVISATATQRAEAFVATIENQTK